MTVDNKGRVTDGALNNTLPYDIVFYIASTPYNIDTVIAGFLSPRVITITAGSLNIAKCNIIPTTTNTVFSINLQGVQVATATFNIGSSIGVISFISGSVISIAIGDILTISTTNVIDSVIAGIGITFVGVSSTINPLL